MSTETGKIKFTLLLMCKANNKTGTLFEKTENL